ncbi:PASTA domain-containing protein [Allorhizocola rhizosphaerae]|uniref:PASTA domain-containing protein n=1 Tax=Allorhizocola rhizosphaerae TaxID=1872709 RepID=UPI000E3E493B|nr:PASTA domain-containing protein [Allorhizocola rhizosphaerae]
MGDQDRTERPNPQEPEPDAEPDAPEQQAGQAPDDAATTRLTPGDDATTQLPPADHTQVMPPAATAWEGRAEVPQPGLRGSTPYPGAEPPVPVRGRTWWTPLLLGLVTLGLVGLVILAAYLFGRDTTPEPQITDTPGPIVPTSATPLTPTTQAPPSPTPSPSPELVEVPRLVGDTRTQATDKLDAAGLSYRLDFKQSNAPRDTVIETDPAAGTQVPRLTTVVLVISLGQSDPTPTTRPTPTGSAGPG